MLSSILKLICFWRKKIRLTQYIENYLELKCCKKNYAWKIRSINNILKEFEQSIDKKIYTDSFSIILCEQLLLFLRERNLRENSVRDVVRKLSGMLNRAQSEGYKIKNYLKHITPKYTITQQVYLIKEELKAIYDLKGLSLQFEIIRDTFLLACYTALRISDLTTLKSIHIVGNNIVKLIQKTAKPIIIPLHPVALEILTKYGNEIPKIKSIQYYNKGIKTICKMAGITQLITCEYIKGGKIVSETVPKYQLVSSHTGRRTAITNLYLEQKVDIITLQKFSGHASINNLLLYIKASSADYLKILSETDYFNENIQTSYNKNQHLKNLPVNNRKQIIKILRKQMA